MAAVVGDGCARGLLVVRQTGTLGGWQPGFFVETAGAGQLLTVVLAVQAFHHVQGGLGFAGVEHCELAEAQGTLAAGGGSGELGDMALGEEGQAGGEIGPGGQGDSRQQGGGNNEAAQGKGNLSRDWEGLLSQRQTGAGAWWSLRKSAGTGISGFALLGLPRALCCDHLATPESQAPRVPKRVARQQTECAQRERTASKLTGVARYPWGQPQHLREPIGHPSQEKHRQTQRNGSVRRIGQGAGPGDEHRFVQRNDSQSRSGSNEAQKRGDQHGLANQRPTNGQQEKPIDGKSDGGSEARQALRPNCPPEASIDTPQDEGGERCVTKEGGEVKVASTVGGAWRSNGADKAV